MSDYLKICCICWSSHCAAITLWYTLGMTDKLATSVAPYCLGILYTTSAMSAINLHSLEAIKLVT